MKAVAVAARFLLVWSIGAVATAAAAEDDSKLYLYRDEKDSPVQDYTKQEGRFLTSTKPRIVEFYSPHCGACQAFKPQYIQLAKDTQQEYGDVEFYAVSCSAQNDMCRKFKVPHYPALYAFAAGDDKEGKIVKKSGSTYKPRHLAEALKLSKDAGTKKVESEKPVTPLLAKPKEIEAKPDEVKPDVEAKDKTKLATEKALAHLKEKKEQAKKDAEKAVEIEAKKRLAAAKSLEHLEAKQRIREENAKAARENQAIEIPKDPVDKAKVESAPEEKPKPIAVEKDEVKNDEGTDKKEDVGAKSDAKEDAKSEDKDDGEEGKDNVNDKSEEKENDNKTEVEEDDEGDKKSGDEDADAEPEDDKDDADAKSEDNKEAKSEDEGNDEDETKAEDGDDEESDPDQDNDSENNDGASAGDAEDNDADDGDSNEEENNEEEEQEKEEDEEQESPDRESEEEPKTHVRPGVGVFDPNSDNGRVVTIDSKGNRRVFGAGSAMARQKNSNMDRWKQSMAEKKKEEEKKNHNSSSSFRSGKSMHEKAHKSHPEHKATAGDMTTAMKSSTPGTPEFEERKKAILEHLKKLRKAGKIKRMPEMFTTGGDVVVLKKDQLPFKKDVRKPSLVQKQVEKIPIVKRIVAMSEEEELILDTSMSFIRSMRYGVFMDDDSLSTKKQHALEAWLDLLSVSLPMEWSLHRLIEKLRRNMKSISKSRNALLNILDSYPMPRNHWSKSCSGVGEFNCGLWKLLHSVTVGVAEIRGGQSLIDAELVDENVLVFSPIDAADTIRDFIDHFFTCGPCRKHFLENYDNCDNNRRCDRLTDATDEASTADWKELALWMWEVHNEVSVRLAKSRHEKEVKQRGLKSKPPGAYEVASLWPNIHMCVRCFQDDGRWDEPEVFELLERTYWPSFETDFAKSKLITFDPSNEKSFRLMWLIIFIAVGFIYVTIGKNNRTLHQSVLRAKHLVNTGSSNKLRTV